MGLSNGEKFHRKNGADCINVNGLLIYSNGASRDRDPQGMLHEPPKDLFDLYTIQSRYREEMLRRCVQDFTELKQRLLSYARAAKRQGYAPPPASDIKLLKDAQLRVQTCQAELAIVKTKLADTPKAKQLAKATQRQAGAALGNDRFVAEIDAIKV